MSEISKNNEANLGQLLFGNRSPMRLNVCLKPANIGDDAMNDLHPFETIMLGVGKRYTLARLSIGDEFSSQYVLLNIFSTLSDSDAVKELTRFTKNKVHPKSLFPDIIDLKTGYTSVGGSHYPPIFYCTKIKHFFHVLCRNCSGILQYEESCDCLICSRCEEINTEHKRFSFYENDDEEILPLQDLFAQYANGKDCSISMPCSGCENAPSCFPDLKNNEAAVANEFHHIIPFSEQPFSVYGISYFPIKLVEYCELLSGQKKSEFLNKVKKNREYGRYEVLNGSMYFNSDADDYLMTKDLNIASIVTFKLRLFNRICAGLTHLDAKSVSLSVQHSNFSMDLSHTVAAGDSFSRAKLSFFPSFTVLGAPIIDGMSPLVYSLSKIFFVMLFKSENTNELDIEQAVEALIVLINRKQWSNEDDFDLLLDTYVKNSSVLCINSLRYYGSCDSDASGRLLLILIKLGLDLTQKINANSEISVSKLNSIEDVASRLNEVLFLVDKMRVNVNTTESDQALKKMIQTWKK